MRKRRLKQKEALELIKSHTGKDFTVKIERNIIMDDGSAGTRETFSANKKPFLAVEIANSRHRGRVYELT